MEASTSSTSLAEFTSSYAAGPTAKRGQKRVFALPSEEQWSWFSLGSVLTEVRVGATDVFGHRPSCPSAISLTNLVKRGDTCEWGTAGEKTCKKAGDVEDTGQDSQESEPEGLPRRTLRLMDGKLKRGCVLVLRSCKVCDLVHDLSSKSLVSLGPWKVMARKVIRPRAELLGRSSPLTMTLSLSVTVRLCINHASPHLCVRQRRKYVPKLLALCNLLRTSQFRASGSASVPASQQNEHSRLRHEENGRGRLAQIFEEASRAPQSTPGYAGTGCWQRQQQREQQPLRAPERRHLLSPNGSSSKQSRASITVLADDLLGLVFSFFDSVALHALGDTCRYMRAATASIVPGLKARLFAHQLRDLTWMWQRENASWTARQYPDPAWEALLVEEDASWEGEHADQRKPEDRRRLMYVNMLTGDLFFDKKEVPLVTDVRGGFLCDEPGLGKTVTALALILKTAGRLPGPVEEEGGMEMVMGHNARRWHRRRTADIVCDTGGMEREGRRCRSTHRRRDLDPRLLRPSGATLIICPGPLMGHWREQIERHAEGWALGEGQVFYDHATGMGTGGWRALPPPEPLALYKVVVVTRERLRQEWISGGPTHMIDSIPPRYAGDLEGTEAEEGDLDNRRLSPLLGVRWLRVLVDEGHSLGSVAITNEGLMSKRLEAERRWVMTGTPHRHDAADLASLHALLSFLRQAPYGSSHNEYWYKLISGRGAGAATSELRRNRLVELLRRIMVRHTKESIPEIPAPHWGVTRLRMSRLEATTYNTLVSLVHANLVTTDMVGGTHAPGALHPDSMLNPINRVSANTLLGNLRLACCGGGAQVVSIEQQSIVMTLQLARRLFLEFQEARRRGRERTAVEEEEDEEAVSVGVARVAAFLNRLRAYVNTPCDACGTFLIILMVTPCLHLLCCQCMKGKNNLCPACGCTFSVDAFQLLQPGLSVHWHEEDLVVLPDRVDKPLDEDVANHKGSGNIVNVDTTSSTVSVQSPSSVPYHFDPGPSQINYHVTSRFLDTGKKADERGENQVGGKESRGLIGHGTLGAGRGPLTLEKMEPPPNSTVGRVSHHTDVNEEHFSEKMDGNADDGSWQVVSKAWHMITHLRAYLENQSSNPSSPDHSLPLKAVVFSQFRVYLNGLKVALENHGFRVGKFYDKTRLADLSRFKATFASHGDEGLQVLLIGKEGSHGLDLSLATHVFLMDQIWDENLQNQVVSRAYRMGAQASVHVERLVMQDTVEEAMETLATGRLGGPQFEINTQGDDSDEEQDEDSVPDSDSEAPLPLERRSESDILESSSSSSLSVMGHGSWEPESYGIQQNLVDRNEFTDVSPVPTTKAMSKRKTSKRGTGSAHFRSGQKSGRSKLSGCTNSGTGAPDAKKMNILLRSLRVVEVNPSPSAVKLSRAAIITPVETTSTPETGSGRQKSETVHDARGVLSLADFNFAHGADKIREINSGDTCAKEPVRRVRFE